MEHELQVQLYFITTKDKSYIGYGELYGRNFLIWLPNGEPQCYKHIYLTSNEEPKTGDWVVDTKWLGFTFNNDIHTIEKGYQYPPGCEKIVATTDKTLQKLGIAAISQRDTSKFIDRYNGGDKRTHGITILKLKNEKLELNNENEVKWFDFV